MTTGTTPALAAPTAPTPADVAPAVNPVDARTALALLGLPNAYELDTPALNAAAARALEAARGCDLTTAEAARIMRTNRQAVEAMCRTGLLPAYQLPDNGHWRIRRTGFDTIRARLNHGRTAPEPTTAAVPRSHRSRSRSRTTNKTTPAPVSNAGA
nr:helix-turn-helix domain-containing protein [Actinomyces oris]